MLYYEGNMSLPFYYMEYMIYICYKFYNYFFRTIMFYDCLLL